MLTEEKLNIFKKYRGDTDGYSRMKDALYLGIEKDSSDLTLTGSDFQLILNLSQDLYLVQKGVTSSEFNKQVESRLQENCDTDTTIQLLKGLVPLLYNDDHYIYSEKKRKT